mgnify:CR=1 FL=1
MQETVTLTIKDAEKLSLAVLENNGFGKEHAGAIMRSVVAAQIDECHSHGLYRLMGCVQTARNGGLDTHAMPEIIDQAPAITRVNAHKGCSLLSFEKALPMFVEKTRHCGISVLAINNCFHFSALWPEVEQISAESSQSVAAQRSQIEQVATAMNEMAATSQEVARSAALAVNNAEQVNTETLNGRRLVESSVDGIEKLAGEIANSVRVINQLAEDSASISRVLDVIKGVAEQTNLLALNAAIEAARAGEQGRGFAVVADEVRTLARRTQQSTEEIEQMIVRLQDGVGAAVRAMDSSHGMTASTVDASLRVQQGLDSILKAVTQIVDQSQQIAAAAEQQTVVSHDIDQNIVQINEAGERTAEGARRAEDASGRMGQLVQSLQGIINAFKV